jgi:PPK2 family polyphosphate:nucleotide phosphotransferase
MGERYFEPIESPYRVAFDGTFKVDDAPTKPPKSERRQKQRHQEHLQHSIERMHELQGRLYAADQFALLLVFQAMDAAGKDGTIRAVMSGINPAGCQVYSFKQPSAEELDHDFMWRIYRALPERGRIGIFNRSHYEEVLAVRVHPEYLEGQKLPEASMGEKIWKERYESIRDVEKHLARNGTVIVKFWLNFSRDQQKKRFLDRIDEPESHWKFSPSDVEERRHWKKYMEAYEDALNATSRPWAPWYAVPADDKPFMRRAVAEIVVETLQKMDPKYPELTEEKRARMLALHRELNEQDL